MSYLPHKAISGQFTIQCASILVLYFKKEKKRKKREDVSLAESWNAQCAIEVKFVMFEMHTA